MKETLIIFIILVIVLSGAFYTYKYLKKTTNELIINLDDIKNGIENKNISKEEIEQKMENVYTIWNKTNGKWSNIVLHDEIDLIETSLIRAKSKIKIGKIEDSMEDIDTSIFLVNHILEKEKINIKNIF